MNGGEITISVKADYSEMERSLVEAEQKAAQSAEGAAEKYQSKFGAWLDRSRGSISKKFEGFINPVQLLDRVADFAETAGEEGIGTAIDNLVKSTPIIGAAYRLGTSIGTALVNAVGAETGEQMDARLQEEFEKTIEAADRRLKIVAQKEAEAREATATNQKAADLEFEIAVRRLEKEGKIKEAIFERGLKEEQRLELEAANKLADANTEAQKDAIRREYDARIQLNADDTRDRIEKQEKADAKILADKIEDDAKAISDRVDKEIKAAEKVADKEKKIKDDADKKREKKLADQQKAFDEATRIEEERITSQTAGISSANTALGTFKFDAYPDSEKKNNDARMVRALEALVNTGGSGGFA